MNHKRIESVLRISLLFALVTATVAGYAQVDEAQLLGTWDDPEILGSNQFDNRYSEIWGFEKSGYEYAILGSTEGTHLIDITDPTNPTEAFFIDALVSGGQVIHRDYHTYKGYLYAVCDEGPSSLQIIDLNHLPDSANVVYDSRELVHRAHNIFIDTSSALLYLCAASGGASGFSPLALIDISIPTEPKFLKSYQTFGADYSIGHVHDAFVVNDTAFLNCGNDGLVIANFEDPLNPETISIVRPGDYPQSGYNHSGWISEDHRYYYMADENHGLDLKVIDLSNIYNPTVIKTFNAGSTSSLSIPHNMIVRCNQLYVSYYYDGYQVFDITDPASPQRTSSFDTYPQANNGSYKGAWGIYPYLPSGNVVVSDMQSGLFVFAAPSDSDCGLISSTSSPVEQANGYLIFPTLLSSQTIYLEALDHDEHGPIEVCLLNSNGVQVWQSQIKQPQTIQMIDIDVPLPSGVYLMQVRSAYGVQTQKLIKH